MEEETITTTTEIPFKELMEKYRSELKEFGTKVKFAKLHSSCFQSNAVPAPDTNMDKGEMVANIMLSYRHIEDAIMRLGKAIQAHDGGVNIYDKK